MRRLVLLVFLALCLSAVASAQEKLPLPEMQKLAKLYVGTWTYTETYGKGTSQTGVYTSELGPGGNSIVNRFHSKGPVGDFDGLLIMTWEPAEKAYKAWAFGDVFSGAIAETGQWEGDVLVYRGEVVMGGKKIALRNTTKWENGKIVSDEFMSAGGAPEKLVVHVEAVKK
jgi:hypothetical protein